jgi:transcriptional regulator with XRE-family HTH domain
MRRGFAERLRAARVTAGHATQKDMADALKVEHERYRMWERGDREPDITNLVNIANTLKISLDFLLLGKRDIPVNRRAG